MAELTGKTISELPSATTLADADLFAVSAGGSSKKLPWANLKSAITGISAIATAISDVSALKATTSFDTPGTLLSSYTSGLTAVGKKSYGIVSAYLTFGSTSPSNGGSIGTVKTGYRPAHTVCVPVFGASSPYSPVGSLFIYADGTTGIYYADGTPKYIYLNYQI